MIDTVFPNYKYDYNSENVIVAPTFNAREIDSFPIYGINYMGQPLPRFSNETCEEFHGDCYEFAQKHLEMYFTQIKAFPNDTETEANFTINECSKNDTDGINHSYRKYERMEMFRDKTRTINNEKQDNLYVCGPYENLTV